MQMSSLVFIIPYKQLNKFKQILSDISKPVSKWFFDSCIGL